MLDSVPSLQGAQPCLRVNRKGGIHVTKRPLYNYRVRVYDSRQDRLIDYAFRAMTDGSAIQLAKDGYTGLLGNHEETHKQLEVTIIGKELLNSAAYSYRI